MTSREKIFNLPGVIVTLVAGLAMVHGLREYGLTDEQDAELLRRFAFTPGRFTYLFDPDGVADSFARFDPRRAEAASEAAKFFLGDGRPQWWTVLTYAALHADWLHVGVNSLWLAAFGTPPNRNAACL